MHSALTQDLASQHSVRAGWALVPVGQRLALHQPG